MSDVAHSSDVADSSGAGLIRLRGNAFGAVVMLVVQTVLGVSVNLYADLPAADHGTGTFAAFADAVAKGPVALTIHALLGTLILAAAVSIVVRAALLRSRPLIVIATVGLIAVVGAWLSGARFVGDGTNGASLSMATAAGIAIFAYALLVFIIPAPARARERG